MTSKQENNTQHYTMCAYAEYYKGYVDNYGKYDESTQARRRTIYCLNRMVECADCLHMAGLAQEWRDTITRFKSRKNK